MPSVKTSGTKRGFLLDKSSAYLADLVTRRRMHVTAIEGAAVMGHVHLVTIMRLVTILTVYRDVGALLGSLFFCAAVDANLDKVRNVIF